MKYDVEIDMSIANSHKLILEQLQPNSTVLEFGPAYGAMTQYMKQNLNCKVYIVELVKEAFDSSIEFAEDGICSDIMELEWINKFSYLKFDYIIFADVLEHINNPKIILSECKDLLKDNGRVLLSTPNIAHDSIIINLISDSFFYTETGLLDDTHIKLFAYNSLVQLCIDAGFSIVGEDAVYVEAEQSEQSQFFSSNYYEIWKNLSFRPQGNIYQFIFNLGKSKDYKSESRKINELLFENNKIQMSLFIDTGVGFNERECIRERAVTEEDAYIVKFEIPNGTKSLRFDPLEGKPCKVHIKSIETDGVVNRIYPANASLKSDEPCGELYDEFWHIDPVYELEGDCSSMTFIIITLKIKLLNPFYLLEKSKSLIKNNEKLIHEKEQLILLQQDRICLFETTLQKMSINIESLRLENEKLCLERRQLENDIINLESSFSWKVTKPLRKIKKFLK